MRTFYYQAEHIGTLADDNGKNAKRPRVNVLGREFSWPPINRHMIDKRRYVVLPDVINEAYEVKADNEAIVLALPSDGEVKRPRLLTKDKDHDAS